MALGVAVEGQNMQQQEMRVQDSPPKGLQITFCDLIHQGGCNGVMVIIYGGRDA